MTKPLLVKVGDLCVKKGGAHFDTPPSSLSWATQQTELGCLRKKATESF